MKERKAVKGDPKRVRPFINNQSTQNQQNQLDTIDIEVNRNKFHLNYLTKVMLQTGQNLPKLRMLATPVQNQFHDEKSTKMRIVQSQQQFSGKQYRKSQVSRYLHMNDVDTDFLAYCDDFCVLSEDDY